MYSLPSTWLATGDPLVLHLGSPSMASCISLSKTATDQNILKYPVTWWYTAATFLHRAEVIKRGPEEGKNSALFFLESFKIQINTEWPGSSVQWHWMYEKNEAETEEGRFVCLLFKYFLKDHGRKVQFLKSLLIQTPSPSLFTCSHCFG